MTMLFKTNDHNYLYNILNELKEYGYTKRDIEKTMSNVFDTWNTSNKTKKDINNKNKTKRNRYDYYNINYNNVILMRAAFSCSEKYCDDGMQKGCYFIPSSYDDIVLFRDFTIAFQEVSNKIQRGEGRTLDLTNKKSSCVTYFYNIPLFEMEEETIYVPTQSFEEKGITYDICYDLDNYKFDVRNQLKNFLNIYQNEKRENIEFGSENSKFDLQYLFSFVDNLLE